MSYALLKHRVLERMDDEGYAVMDYIDDILEQLDVYKKDTARIDWLADSENTIGNVTLPTHIVLSNVDSLRKAIDVAMFAYAMDKAATGGKNA